jgi:hypothetical protein
MADDKKTDEKVILLVAVERGFAMGRMVQPGETFRFRTVGDDGKPRKLPKWAQPADEPMPAKKLLKNGDLKPADAQAAVAQKAGILSGAKAA